MIKYHSKILKYDIKSKIFNYLINNVSKSKLSNNLIKNENNLNDILDNGVKRLCKMSSVLCHLL